MRRYLALIMMWPGLACAQSADWQQVIWREPQVRYLVADMTLGGNVALYRDFATREKDPDSIEAVRLWDAGARVVNTNEFERRWLTNKFGRDGRVMRVVHRGTDRTITGNEVLLSSDTLIHQASVRIALAELTLGRPVATLQGAMANPEVAEAVRRWTAGCRVVNTNLFEARGSGPDRRLYFRNTDRLLDPFFIRLNSDVPYPETNVRYFMADIALGGSIEFYRAAAERDHEMGCLEAVRRTEEGFKVTNLDQFERKQVDGKTLITRKGANRRISGMEVQLSSDLVP
ncbi:MAG: hypothetical protein L6Q38_14095 [Nitrospira sp.]|nr:hypothetical protein [Nitrospira sp.]